ncbi:PHP domain-containing protein [Devriesea agamarum]|uniref:PHP domain-containing protein n=1 Tax=Devriesea agamarum TaxID=472569 RepID=UPI000A02D674|nr:PHP domain-containing protein [Devriesea agamarum]
MDRDLRIDLHTHSTHSDGTDSVPELLRAAAEAGVGAIGLTDHDTFSGWDEARVWSARVGVAVIPGCEVSTEYEHHSVHVLALLPDPSPGTDLAKDMARARSSRDDRARHMVELISRDYPVTWQDVQAQLGGAQTVVGRPHIADALVEAGIVPDRSAAFADILTVDGPYYVRHYAPDPVRAVQQICSAGGVAIAAHPGSVSRGWVLPDDVLEAMIEAGLAGIEVDHREHDAQTRRRLASLAAAHGLLTTGSSDYHGTGKPNRLGENLTSPDVLAAIIARATSETEVFAP